MTVRITVLCDGRGCAREAEIERDSDREITRIGWKIDPFTDGQHYCPKCWPKVEKELADE